MKLLRPLTIALLQLLVSACSTVESIQCQPSTVVYTAQPYDPIEGLEPAYPDRRALECYVQSVGRVCGDDIGRIVSPDRRRSGRVRCWTAVTESLGVCAHERVDVLFSSCDIVDLSFVSMWGLECELARPAMEQILLGGRMEIVTPALARTLLHIASTSAHVPEPLVGRWRAVAQESEPDSSETLLQLAMEQCQGVGNPYVGEVEEVMSWHK